MERDGAEVTCDGRLFHRRAAATGNALGSNVLKLKFFSSCIFCIKRIKYYPVVINQYAQSNTSLGLCVSGMCYVSINGNICHNNNK